MTVKEVIEELSKYGKNLRVVGVNEETGETVDVYGFYGYGGKVYVDLDEVLHD